VLGVRRGASLVSIERTTVDAEGRPFEHTHDLFRADRMRIVVRARALASSIQLV
jgi:GntR family transcriptional regulator